MYGSSHVAKYRQSLLDGYRDLFHNHTEFRDSKAMVGLQVADICANICYRFYRDDRKDIRAYERLWRRIMCKGGVGVLDMDEYKRLGEEKEKAVNAEREYE